MRLLLDSCVWPGAQATLERAGHEVEWVGNWKSDPGDDAILAHAAQHQQVIVTLDKDFDELVVVFGAPHAADLTEGAIVTAERGRTRIRPLDEQDNGGEGGADH